MRRAEVLRRTGEYRMSQRHACELVEILRIDSSLGVPAGTRAWCGPKPRGSAIGGCVCCFGVRVER